MAHMNFSIGKPKHSNSTIDIQAGMIVQDWKHLNLLTLSLAVEYREAGTSCHH